MNRTKERKIIFEIIFMFPFNKNKDIDAIMNAYKGSNDIEIFSDYITSTVCGVYNNLKSIDEKISSTIKTRSFERLDNVCLAAMRYATYEIIYNDDMPDSIAVNEAIELTKQYDDSLGAFVHANLGKISNSKNG